MAKSEVKSQQWVDKIEELVRRVESMADADARLLVSDLLRAVLDFHAAALERMLDITYQVGPAGEAIIERVTTDDLVSSVLLLHDLHPDNLETRVEGAVQRLSETFRSLGAKLSLIAVEAGTVRLQFDSQRTWPGTPVKGSIEKAILQAAPEIELVLIEGLQETPPPGFVPVSNLLAGLPVRSQV